MYTNVKDQKYILVYSLVCIGTSDVNNSSVFITFRSDQLKSCVCKYECTNN